MSKTIRVVAAVISQDGRYLVTQRRPTAVLPLLWEFPGGRVDCGETDVAHAYEHYTVELHLYDCRITGGEPVAMNVHQFRWVESADFEELPFTPADEASMSRLLGLTS